MPSVTPLPGLTGHADDEVACHRGIAYYPFEMGMNMVAIASFINSLSNGSVASGAESQSTAECPEFAPDEIDAARAMADRMQRYLTHRSAHLLQRASKLPPD